MRPTIILGMSRSGSKLLKNTLNVQKDVYCAGEIVWNHTFNKSNLERYVSGNRKLCKDTARVEYDAIPIEQLIAFRKSSIQDLSKFMHGLKAHHGVSHIVAKYPVSLQNWARASDFEKNLLNVVVLIRDPFSVLRSDTVYKKSRWPLMPFVQIILSLYHCYQYCLALKIIRNSNVIVFDYVVAMSSLTSFKREMKQAFSYVDEANLEYPNYKNSSIKMNQNKYSEFRPNIVAKLVLMISDHVYKKIINKGV